MGYVNEVLLMSETGMGEWDAIVTHMKYHSSS